VDERGFFAEFLQYLWSRKRLWLVPILGLSLVLLLLAALLFGPGAALEAVYQIF
jgi:hypothetical protein